MWHTLRSFRGAAAARGPIALIAIAAASADLSCGRSERDGRGTRPSPTSGGAGGFPEAGAGSGGTAADGTTGGSPTGGSPTGGTPVGVGGSGGVGPGDGGESGQPGGAGADGGRGGFDFDCYCTTCTAPFEYCHLSFIDEDAPSIHFDATCLSVPAQCEDDYTCGCIGPLARFDETLNQCSGRLQQLPNPGCVDDAQDGVRVWVPGP